MRSDRRLKVRFCGAPGCGFPHQAVEPRHEWLRGGAPRRDRGDRRRPGALAARPAPLRDHVLRRQRVDRAERGRPDHQRARRGRGGTGTRSSTSSTSGRARFELDGERVEAGRGHIRLRAPRRQAHRLRRGAGHDDHRPRGDAGEGIRARRLGDLGAAQPALRGGRVRRGGQTEGGSLPRRHPEYPGLLYNVACCESLAGRRNEAIEHLRLAIERSDRSRSLSPPATPTSIRFATTLRSGSWSGRPNGRYSKRIRFGSSRMRSTRAGTPATTAFAGTSRVTTAFVPITALSPTVTPRRMQAP